jgi:hypothetical protein
MLGYNAPLAHPNTSPIRRGNGSRPKEIAMDGGGDLATWRRLSPDGVRDEEEQERHEIHHPKDPYLPERGSPASSSSEDGPFLPPDRQA